ncbi:MAG TPA: N-acetylmuramoyl-L-alanine amidase [Terriglobia bacterium]|nr:N-acetylmuramoyl-L-alanine amidase [Terriglobia bacterium]
MVWAVAAAPLSASPPRSRPSARRERAAKAYATALRLRAALEARRPQARSYKSYMKVVRAFDQVYRVDHAYARTPTAIFAEAALYQEMGHVFENGHYFESAIATYEFLADQYGGAPVARDVLLAIGDIYRVDLRDDRGAAKAYTDYLTRYPYAEHAAEARLRLKEMNRHAAERASEAAQAAENPADEAPAAQRVEKTTESAPEAGGSALPGGHLLAVNDVRYWEGPDYVRIVISVDDEAKYESARLSHPDRIVVDLPGTHLARTLKGKSFPIGNGFLRDVRVAQFKPDVSRIVLDVAKLDDYSVFTLPNPFRLIIDVRGPTQPLVARSETRQPPASASERRSPAARPQPLKSAPDAGQLESPDSAPSTGSPAMAEDTSAEAARSGADDAAVTPSSTSAPEGSQPLAQTSSGSNTLTRALGLKIARIVIDPGHGGHDTGTIGPDGLEEKNVVLDVGLRLRKLIQQRMGAQVVMTRSDDTFIPLEERTAIANQRGADLFISIHANASRDASARGIEVYYLNFTSDPNSLEVAARENATSQESVYQLQSLIKKIALSEKIQESGEFARMVDRSLGVAAARTGNEQPDRGLKKAPFVVLIGANMPSILAEISFLTNPRDERLLGQSNYRQQIAEGLYRGIARYVATLGSLRIAQRTSNLPPGGRTSRARIVPPPASTVGTAPDY